VAAALEHLPLALALAAPVIRGQRHGYVRYLDRLQTIPTEVHLTGAGGQPYPHGVARAVSLSLAAIRAADKTGMCTRVIEIMAVLSAAGVRRELLHVVGRAGVLAGGGHRVEAALVDRALEWLSDRSLLTFSLDGQTVTMHRWWRTWSVTGWSQAAVGGGVLGRRICAGSARYRGGGVAGSFGRQGHPPAGNGAA